MLSKHATFSELLYSSKNNQKSKQISLQSLSNSSKDQDDQLEEVIKVMKKFPEQRTNDDIQVLEQYINSAKFFKQIINDYGKDTFHECLRYMNHMFVRSNDIVFQIDSIGTQFYVILRGSVSVIAKHHKKIIQNEKYQDDDDKVLMHVRTLNSGQSFGEFSLIDNKPRLATIKTQTDCHFAVLDKIHYKRILKAKEEQKLMGELSFLFSVKAFSQWTYNGLKNLYINSNLKVYPRGQIIFKENDVADKAFIVKTGDFKITKEVCVQEIFQDTYEVKNLKSMCKWSNKTKYKTFEVGIVSKGVIFGEEDIIKQRPRQFTVTCISVSAEILEITKKNFYNIIMNEYVTSKSISENAAIKDEWYQKRIGELQGSLLKNLEILDQKINKYKFQFKFAQSDQIPQSYTNIITNLNNHNKHQPNVNNQFSISDKEEISDFKNNIIILKRKKDIVPQQPLKIIYKPEKQKKFIAQPDKKFLARRNSLTIKDNQLTSRSVNNNFRATQNKSVQSIPNIPYLMQTRNHDLENTLLQNLKQLLQNKRLALESPRKDQLQTDQYYSEILHNHQNIQNIKSQVNQSGSISPSIQKKQINNLNLFDNGISIDTHSFKNKIPNLFDSQSTTPQLTSSITKSCMESIIISRDHFSPAKTATKNIYVNQIFKENPIQIQKPQLKSFSTSGHIKNLVFGPHHIQNQDQKTLVQSGPKNSSKLFSFSELSPKKRRARNVQLGQKKEPQLQSQK